MKHYREGSTIETCDCTLRSDPFHNSSGWVAAAPSPRTLAPGTAGRLLPLSTSAGRFTAAPPRPPILPSSSHCRPPTPFHFHPSPPHPLILPPITFPIFPSTIPIFPHPPTKGIDGYYQAKARSIDFSTREVTCADIFHRGKSLDDKEGTTTGDYQRFVLPYDLLVVATGCKTNTFNIPGIAEREGREVQFLKHLYHARSLRNRMLECTCFRWRSFIHLSCLTPSDPPTHSRTSTFVRPRHNPLAPPRFSL